MRETIKIKCRSCGQEQDVERTKEIPLSAVSVVCNWCPGCQDTAQEDYREWFLFRSYFKAQRPHFTQLKFDF